MKYGKISEIYRQDYLFFNGQETERVYVLLRHMAEGWSHSVIFIENLSFMVTSHLIFPILINRYINAVNP